MSHELPISFCQHGGNCDCFTDFRARIAALESSLRERDERVKALEGALRNIRVVITSKTGRVAPFYAGVELIASSALSPAPAAKEDAHGCGLCGHNHPTSTHTAPGGRLL